MAGQSLLRRSSNKWLVGVNGSIGDNTSTSNIIVPAAGCNERQFSADLCINCTGTAFDFSIEATGIFSDRN